MNETILFLICKLTNESIINKNLFSSAKRVLSYPWERKRYNNRFLLNSFQECKNCCANKISRIFNIYTYNYNDIDIK